MNEIYPQQFGPIKSHKPAKPVFYNVGPRMTTPPLGTLPVLTEGGGRYDSDLEKQGWQEDSYWVGNYRGERREIDEEELGKALATIPPGMHYCFNVEHWPLNIRKDDDHEVEDSIRRFRHFYKTCKKYRPDLRYSLYAFTPNRDYHSPHVFHKGWVPWMKYQKHGVESLTDTDKRNIGLVAKKTSDGEYEWNHEGKYVVRFREWQKANDRLTFGFRDNKKLVHTWGLVDALDFLCPSLYDFYEGDDTEAYVYWNIMEARRMGGRKKIYPFVWPRYHNSNKKVGGQTIPLDEWRFHVRRVLKYADGCVVWGAKEEHDEHVWIALDEAERAVSNRDGTEIITYAQRDW